MNTPHPHAQLSAYLDGALDQAERGTVEAHLASCPDCRARLAEIRATASLIRGLPDLAPSRRLVPRVAVPPAWLAPVRTLSTLASGVSVFLFLASALLANVSQLTGTSGAAAPALAPAGGAGAATAASATPSRALGAADTARGEASGSPAAPPQAVSGASAPTASAAVRAPVPATASPKLSVTDTLQKSAAPSAAEFNAASPSSVAAAESARDQRYSERSGPTLGSPWLWLALAVITGAIAIALQRRLRSA